MKYEFDNIEEWKEANNHLEDYHDCEKCHGKIVGIQIDKLGQTHCGYCGEIVKYPRLKEMETDIKAGRILSPDSWQEYHMLKHKYPKKLNVTKEIYKPSEQDPLVNYLHNKFKEEGKYIGKRFIKECINEGKKLKEKHHD